MTSPLPRLLLLHVAKTAGTAVQSFLRSLYDPSTTMIRIEADRPNGFAAVLRQMPGARFASGHVCLDEAWSLAVTPTPDAHSADRPGVANDSWRFALTLRDPVARTWSNLQYYLRLPKTSLAGEFLDLRERLEREPLERFLDTMTAPLELHNFVNLQTRFLLDFEEPSRPLRRADLETALARLDHIEFFFMADRLRDSLELFCRELGVPQRTTLPPTNTQATAGGLATARARHLPPPIDERLRAMNALDCELWAHALRRFDDRLARARADAPTPRTSTSGWDGSARQPSAQMLDLRRPDGGSWRWAGFDFGAWDLATRRPRGFMPARLGGDATTFVAWTVERRAILWLRASSLADWRVECAFSASSSTRQLMDLAVRVNDVAVVHRFRVDTEGELWCDIDVPRALIANGQPWLELALADCDPLHLDEYEPHPGLGEWLDLPRVGLALRAVAIVPLAPGSCASPSGDASTHSLHDRRLHALATACPPVSNALDLSPAEALAICPALAETLRIGASSRSQAASPSARSTPAATLACVAKRGARDRTFELRTTVEGMPIDSPGAPHGAMWIGLLRSAKTCRVLRTGRLRLDSRGAAPGAPRTITVQVPGHRFLPAELQLSLVDPATGLEVGTAAIGAPPPLRDVTHRPLTPALPAASTTQPAMMPVPA